MQIPIRNSHSSTSDLLTWPELPPLESAAAVTCGHRACQPSDKIGEVLQGSQFAEEEATQSLIKKKSCLGYKMKEMTGSGIFLASAEDDTTSEANRANSEIRTSIRVYQQSRNGISQISFSTEESISLEKPTSLPKAAKHLELSGTLQSEIDKKTTRQISSAKAKELSGNDIFAPAPEIVLRSLPPARTLLELNESNDMGEPVPRNGRASVKAPYTEGDQRNVLFGEETVKTASKKLHDQKFAELTGNNIFKEDVPPVPAEKYLSSAKLREMSGSGIFSDGKIETTENLRGTRRAPCLNSRVNVL